MLKKIFITTITLFSFMHLSFSTNLRYVNNYTKKDIRFKTSAVYYLKSGYKGYSGSVDIDKVISSGSRIFIPYEVKQKDPRSAEIVLTTIPNLPSKVIVDGQETTINWVGKNIVNLDKQKYGAQRLDTSKEKYKGGYSVFLKNYRMENINGKLQPVVDIEFIAGDLT
ncbi:MAG: hypothetical protein HRT87_02415 [Legionellales bacterium]|nr:hypothetical protein [Legionellales bacterium]